MSRVNIIVALNSEARPLIDYFRLKRSHKSSTIGTIYQSDNVTLAVSGIGRTACAATVGFVHGISLQPHTLGWLNVGVAGHSTTSIGEGFLAHSICEQATGKVWYPPMMLDISIPTERIITVDVVETQFAQKAAYDMEASGFFLAASRASTTELVQSYKVISDNKTQRAEQLTESSVTELIDGQIGAIARSVEVLTDLSVSFNGRNLTSGLEQRFLDRWHFSFTQRQQLTNYLIKLKALGYQEHGNVTAYENCSDAKSVLQALKSQYLSNGLEY